jgi:DNA-binding PadR family transcriptional regulator
MKTEDRILRLVAEYGPMSGGEIWKKLGWRRWFISVYPALMNLEREGWLDSKWADEPQPRRRLYSFIPSS